MRLAETIHRYPRPLNWANALLAALLVGLAIVNLGIVLLRGIWDLRGRNEELLADQAILRGLVTWIEAHAGPATPTLSAFLPTLLGPLAWLGIALLATLLLRNALPTIRTSDMGMLVEFAGSWLPLRWEDLRVMRVTSDVSGEHFVILVETDARQLTSWHRWYSLVYSLGGNPGFLITSTISEFDQLLQTMINQNERTARAVDGAKPVDVREDEPSPLFRLLLSPAAFFSGRSRDEQAPATPSAPNEGAATSTSISQSYSDSSVMAHYPTRISRLLDGISLALIGLLALSYLGYWIRWVALSVPSVRTLPPFSWATRDPGYAELFAAFATQPVPFMGIATRPDLPAPWWLLVAAHLMLLMALPLILWLRTILPGVESRSDGMAVRQSNGRWRVIPWQQISAFRATEIDEERQVLLLQSSRLANPSRFSSLIYDGSFTPGVLITSAIANFHPLLGHALNRLVPLEREDKPPVLQQEARSWLLWLALDRKAALAALVHDARSDLATKVAEVRPLLTAAIPLALLALLTSLLLVVNQLLGHAPPGFGLIFAVIALWIFTMLEWPVVSLSSVLLDERTGGGEEGLRALYLYPQSQLPRMLPLLAAILFELLRLPLLPILAWIVAIAWSYWLMSELCTQLYEWKGSQVILGGLLPVLWQLLVLILFLVLT